MSIIQFPAICTGEYIPPKGRVSKTTSYIVNIPVEVKDCQQEDSELICTIERMNRTEKLLNIDNTLCESINIKPLERVADGVNNKVSVNEFQKTQKSIFGLSKNLYHVSEHSVQLQKPDAKKWISDNEAFIQKQIQQLFDQNKITLLSDGSLWSSNILSNFHMLSNHENNRKGSYNVWPFISPDNYSNPDDIFYVKIPAFCPITAFRLSQSLDINDNYMKDYTFTMEKRIDGIINEETIRDVVLYNILNLYRSADAKNLSYEELIAFAELKKSIDYLKSLDVVNEDDINMTINVYKNLVDVFVDNDIKAKFSENQEIIEKLVEYMRDEKELTCGLKWSNNEFIPDYNSEPKMRFR